MDGEEERTPSELEDPSAVTPSPAAGEQGDTSEQGTVDWEKRYTDFQSGVTPKLQELAQLKEREADLQWLDTLRSDPEAQAEALRQLASNLGYQLEGDEAPDPFQTLEDRIAQVEAQNQQYAEQAQEDQVIDQIDQFVTNELSGLAQGEGRTFTEREQKVILSHAVSAFPPDEMTGMPQVQAAFEEIKGLLDDSRQRWVESKRSPTVPQPGTAGSQKVDLSDDEARIAHTARYFDAARDAGQ